MSVEDAVYGRTGAGESWLELGLVVGVELAVGILALGTVGGACKTTLWAR